MLCIAALSADGYIYKSVVCWHSKRIAVRVGYIVFAVVSDLGVLAALHIYGAGDRNIVAIMWMVWAFFLLAVPKLLYLVGGLLDFLIRLVIRRRSVVFRWTMGAAGAVSAVMMVLGATVWRTQLRTTEVEICSPRVSEAFDGYRIVQFSDVHLGTTVSTSMLERVVDTINDLDPDIVVSTGDLVNIDHSELTDEAAAVLCSIEAPVYSVWGNHDLGFYIDDYALTPQQNLALLTDKVMAMGWHVLSDRSVWIRRGADSLLLTGLDYPSGRAHNGNNDAMAGVDFEAAFNIVLSHTPELWGEIYRRNRGDVTLSGHTHAMQMKLSFFGGRPWSLARLMYSYWSGLYVADDVSGRRLYVNDGIGCVGYPMRLGSGVRPELTIFTLKRCE